MIANVAAYRMPVEGALVAAECGNAKSARLTDDRGHAQLVLHDDRHDASKCVVTVAEPSLPTVRFSGASTCTAPLACPTMFVELAR